MDRHVARRWGAAQAIAAMKLSTRLAIAMVALALFTTTAMALFSYRTIEAALVPHALERIDSHTRLLAAELEGYLRGVRADVVGFRSGAGPEGIVRARLNGGPSVRLRTDHIPSRGT